MLRLDGQELAAWRAFERIYGPIGPLRGDLHAGMICSTLANIHRDTKKRKKPFGPADFMPFKEPHQVKPQPVKAQMRAAKVLSKALDGNTKKPNS